MKRACLHQSRAVEREAHEEMPERAFAPSIDDDATWSDGPDTPHCAACEGIGWLRPKLPVGAPGYNQLIPCACTTIRRARRRLAQLQELSHIDAFQAQTFATFNRLVPGLQVAYQRARTFAQNPTGWLTLLGPCGCGKTHLAAAIAHAAFAAEQPALLVVVPDLLDHLRATYSPTSTVSYDQVFTHVREVELLILDDLGTESATPWAREKMYQLINHRYNHRLATVFTSNIRLEQLDPRVASRMHDPALPACIVTIQAQDYRRRPLTPDQRHRPTTPDEGAQGCLNKR
ncbi:ATP-binding protein [Candidatus Chloroploca sp. M-50]|uniref:ATP-binding protein n=1 Tax=Candidatus Chloroploca mongolica TaxID=2528176 RepID=A0ABS4D9U0_9CHLR|nr:ATP-binding protein [Candidatus Chloroploca mongolica]MBP1466179.1 ATP-binding protein [Candidatus Chloroploca mongolica]